MLGGLGRSSLSRNLPLARRQLVTSTGHPEDAVGKFPEECNPIDVKWLEESARTLTLAEWDLPLEQRPYFVHVPERVHRGLLREHGANVHVSPRWRRLLTNKVNQLPSFQMLDGSSVVDPAVIMKAESDIMREAFEINKGPSTGADFCMRAALLAKLGAEGFEELEMSDLPPEAQEEWFRVSLRTRDTKDFACSLIPTTDRPRPPCPDFQLNPERRARHDVRRNVDQVCLAWVNVTSCLCE